MGGPVKHKKVNKTLVIVVAAVIGAVAYGAAHLANTSGSNQTASDHKEAKPWYKNHAKPPEMIRLPDAPLILAAKEAEVDETVQELKPKQPLKKIQVPPPASVIPRLNSVEISAKPVAPPTVYEEALPQDIYTPTKMATKVSTPEPDPEKTPPLAIKHQQPRWVQYALKMNVPKDTPMIALVIDDLGLDRKRTARAIALSGPITMAFIPYAKDLKKQTGKARANGHELLVHLPMEPLNAKIDAGPNNLNTHLAAEDLKDRIHWNLERFSGYVGVNNHMGSRATTDDAVMKALMSELRNREMLFLDSRTNPKSIAAKIAGLEGVPFAERNVFLDNVNEKGAVLKQLSLLEKVSRRSGFAVGIGHPRDGTIAALQEWLPTAQSKGFILVPISQIVLKNQGLS